MLHVSRYHSGSLKVRAASRFNFSNFHTAFRTKNRRRRPVASSPTSSLPHKRQVLRSFRPFLIKRRRVPTLPASTMVKKCAASSHLPFSSSIRPCSSRWRSHMGAVSSASALAILSRRLLISSSGMCSMKSAATSLLTISGHLDDSNYLLPSYDEGAGFSLGRRKNDILISKTGRSLKELSPDADLKVVKRSRRSLCRVLRAGKRRSH